MQSPQPTARHHASIDAGAVATARVNRLPAIARILFALAVVAALPSPRTPAAQTPVLSSWLQTTLRQARPDERHIVWIYFRDKGSLGGAIPDDHRTRGPAGRTHLRHAHREPGESHPPRVAMAECGECRSDRGTGQRRGVAADAVRAVDAGIGVNIGLNPFLPPSQKREKWVRGRAIAGARRGIAGRGRFRASV